MTIPLNSRSVDINTCIRRVKFHQKGHNPLNSAINCYTIIHRYARRRLR